MSGQKLRTVVRQAKLSDRDRTWFPRWLGWYAAHQGLSETQGIPVSRDFVIAFLIQQKANGKRAWQRMQAVRSPLDSTRPVVPQA